MRRVLSFTTLCALIMCARHADAANTSSDTLSGESGVITESRYIQSNTQPSSVEIVMMQTTVSAGTTPTSKILPSLFRQSSATSGIRVIQNAAQTIADMFTVPSTAVPHDVMGITPLQNPVTAALNNINESSYMITATSTVPLQNTAQNSGAKFHTVDTPNDVVSNSASSKSHKTQKLIRTAVHSLYETFINTFIGSN